MRKRLVVYETTRSEEGRDVWVVRLKGREDRLDLVDPKLNEAQVAEVSQQLGEILNEELSGRGIRAAPGTQGEKNPAAPLRLRRGVAQRSRRILLLTVTPTVTLDPRPMNV